MKKLYSTIFITLLSLLSAGFSAPSLYSQPQAQNTNMLPPGMSQQEMEELATLLPNEKEMEEIFSSLPPEEAIEAMFSNFSEEDLKKLEQQGQQMIAHMSDEELAELSKTFNIAPDELRDEALRSTESPKEDAVTPQTTSQQPTSSTQKTVSAKNAQSVVQGALTHLSSLRKKTATNLVIHEMLQGWMQEMRELAYYLNVIDTHNHINRLTDTDYEPLFKALQTLHGALKTHEPKILIPADLEEDLDNPFYILGVSSNASQERIDMAFQKLKNQYVEENVKANAEAEGLSSKDKKRAVRSAKLALEAVEDAYGQISNPKLRKQLQRTYQAKNAQHEHDKAQTIESSKKITEALGQAIYQSALLDKLEHFLLDYAPEQLKLKKEMEIAEKKHLKSLSKQAQQRPSVTPGSRLEPQISFPGGPGSHSNDYGYFDYYNQPYGGMDDYMSDYGYPSNFTPFGSSTQQSRNDQQPSQNNTKNEASQDKESSQNPQQKVTRSITPDTNQHTLKTIKNDIARHITSYDKQSSALADSLNKAANTRTKPKASPSFTESDSKQLKKLLSESKINDLAKDMREVQKLLRRTSQLTEQTRAQLVDILESIEKVEDRLMGEDNTQSTQALAQKAHTQTNIKEIKEADRSLSSINKITQEIKEILRPQPLTSTAETKQQTTT